MRLQPSMTAIEQPTRRLPVRGNSMTESSYISLQDVVFSRSGRRIFDGISLDIPRGRITAIMGPSGTGKTTLLRLIGGQLRPESGRILVDGQDVPKLRKKDLYRMRERIGMLFQS